MKNVAFSHNFNCHRSATADDIFTLWSQNKQTTKIRRVVSDVTLLQPQFQRFEMLIHLYRVFHDERFSRWRVWTAPGRFNTWTLLLWRHAVTIDAVYRFISSCSNIHGNPDVMWIGACVVYLSALMVPFQMSQMVPGWMWHSCFPEYFFPSVHFKWALDQRNISWWCSHTAFHHMTELKPASVDGRWTLVTLISGGVPEPLQRFESIVSVCKAVPPEGLKITGMNIEFQLFPVILHCGKLFCKRRHVFFFLFFLQIGERMQIFTREKLCLSKLLFHTQSCYWTVASWPNKMQNVPPVVLKRFFL